MTHTLRETEQLYFRSMGKALRVVAICSTDDEANKYMEKHDDTAVIGCTGPFVILCRKWDKGEVL